MSCGKRFHSQCVELSDFTHFSKQEKMSFIRSTCSDACSNYNPTDDQLESDLCNSIRITNENNNNPPKKARSYNTEKTILSEYQQLILISGFFRLHNTNPTHVSQIVSQYLGKEFKLCDFSHPFRFPQHDLCISGNKIKMDNKECKLRRIWCYIKSRYGFHENNGLNGKHCWRIRYSNEKTNQNRIFIGISKFNTDPSFHNHCMINNYYCEQPDIYGVMGQSNHPLNMHIQERNGSITHEIMKAGRLQNDNSISFLYSHRSENQIDMLLDCANSSIEYSLIDQKDQQTFKITIAPSKTTWIPCIESEQFPITIEIAQIPVSYFGKKFRLVQWGVY